LTWLNTIEPTFRSLEAANLTDRLNDIGAYTAKYAEQFLAVITEFVKDPENKTQFLKEVHTNQVGVRILNRADNNDEEVKPWKIEAGIAYMQTESGYWGSWISSINGDALAHALGHEERMHLVASKSVTHSSTSINKSMTAIENAVGKKVLWIYNNIYDIYDDLKTQKKQSRSDLDSIGNKFEAYATQFKEILPKFLENEDNKEALFEELPGATWYLGVKVFPSAPATEFLIENGCMWMQTEQGYFGSWVSSFTGAALEKILTGDFHGGEVPTEYTGPQGPLNGIWSPQEKVVIAETPKEPVKMNLTQKKDVKAGDAIIAEALEQISKLMGEAFTWEQGIEDVFRGLTAGGKTDQLDKAGTTTASYAKQFVTLFTEFAKDADNKAQLKKEVPENKISFRIQEKKEDGPEVPELTIENGVLYMVSTAGYFGSWLSSKNSEALCKILGTKDPLPLNVRKNVRDSLVKVNKSMEAIAKAIGKPARWQVDVQNVYDRQISEVKARPEDLFTKIGNGLVGYAEQLKTIITKFCENADNKEALNDEFSGSEFVCGVRIVDSGKESVYFAKEDGTLWMNASSSYFGSWISSYTGAELEKIF